MQEPDLIDLFVRPLSRKPIRYLVSGSVAAMLYGEPRVTHDVDLIVFLRPDDLPELPVLYPAGDFYLPPLEVIAKEMAREQRGHFNVLHPASGMDHEIHEILQPSGGTEGAKKTPLSVTTDEHGSKPRSSEREPAPSEGALPPQLGGRGSRAA